MDELICIYASISRFSTMFLLVIANVKWLTGIFNDALIPPVDYHLPSKIKIKIFLCAIWV